MSKDEEHVVVVEVEVVEVVEVKVEVVEVVGSCSTLWMVVKGSSSTLQCNAL